MTIALMIFATAAAYASGIATMLVVNSRRAKLAAPVPHDWLPQTKAVPPPNASPPTVSPPTRSPFAPKPKPVKPPRERQLHWPDVQRNDDSPRLPSVSFLPHNEF